MDRLWILVLVFAVVGCSRGPSSSGSSAKSPASQAGPGLADIAVRASAVAFGPLTALHKASGTVKPVLQSQVASQVGGIVAKVLLKAGDWVAEGGEVIQLDDSQLQLSAKTAEAALEAAKINLSTLQDTTSQASPRLDFQVHSAEAALSAAQRNYESKKALLAQGGATNADVDEANSGYQTAQANLEAAKTALDQNKKADVQDIAQLKLAAEQADYALQQARLNLAHASIRAPYAGRIVSVTLMPGEFVGPDAPAFVIASQKREVDFSVPPSDAGSLPIGSPDRFHLERRGQQTFLEPLPERPHQRRGPLRGRRPELLGPALRGGRHGELHSRPRARHHNPDGSDPDERGQELRLLDQRIPRPSSARSLSWRRAETRRPSRAWSQAAQ